MPYVTEKQPSFIYLSLGTGIGGIGTVGGMKPIDCEPNQTDACASDLLNEYYESIIMMDAIVYDLWDRLQQNKKYKDNTVLLVVSSHGRHTNEFHSFGDNCEGCRHLFLLALGPGIKKGFVSQKKRTLVDVCRTVGALYNLPTPYAKGAVMKELFE
jgi:arylsulfatase A-like enzyme